MKKFILALFFSICCSFGLPAQNDRYDILPVHEGGTIFLGDSITDDCEWNELFGSQDILNRGIDGNTSESVLQRIKEISRHHPAKVFFAIGTNDYPARTPGQVLDNVRKCCDSLAADSPDTRIFIESVLPVGPKQMFFVDGQEAKNEWIAELNRKYERFCAERGYVFIDTHTAFLGKDGKTMAKDLTSDNLHLNGNGYRVLADILRPYVGTKAVALGICTLPDVEVDPGITDKDALFSKAVLAGKVRRAMVFQIMPAHKGSILFAGGSIMEDCEWKEIFNDSRIYNRGIDGATVEEFIAQIPELSRHHAKKIFVEIGSDEALSDPADGVAGTRKAIRALKTACPKTSLYLLGILPGENAGSIKEYNASLAEICREAGVIFIDLYDSFALADGSFDPKYGRSNRKLSAEGYYHLADSLRKYL
ncbi:MAG: GDSL-type esterase/lipase family protein [Bacteroidales bacterium]|jgi:lysophospholipase L1-like esterase|nr:GDSL-type esterase/lipase family protein [Bacteroidales bacterium]MCI2134118.1 GDSL-type esterase/lipase family protein [Bacteroidales bacterium]